MSSLDSCIKAAFENNGKQEKANKVYLTFLKTILFIPVYKNLPSGTEEPFIPLSTVIEDKTFVLGFDCLDRLKNWANDYWEQIAYVEITGKDLITGINENVYFTLNIGDEYSKEFSPDEIKHLKKIVLRINQLIKEE